MYAPNLRKNLISGLQINKKRCKYVDEAEVRVLDNNIEMFRAELKDDLY